MNELRVPTPSSKSSVTSLQTQQQQKQIKAIQKECQIMMKTLLKLQQEEISLKYQNNILAREAINLGYYDSFLNNVDDNDDNNGDGDIVGSGGTGGTGTYGKSGTSSVKKKKINR